MFVKSLVQRKSSLVYLDHFAAVSSQRSKVITAWCPSQVIMIKLLTTTSFVLKNHSCTEDVQISNISGCDAYPHRTT